MKALAPWPFHPDALVGTSLPDMGEMHEVWFQPRADKVDVGDGVEKMRVTSVSMPWLTWWADVSGVEIIGEGRARLSEPETAEVEDDARTGGHVLDDVEPEDQRTSLAGGVE